MEVGREPGDTLRTMDFDQRASPSPVVVAGKPHITVTESSKSGAVVDARPSGGSRQP